MAMGMSQARAQRGPIRPAHRVCNQSRGNKPDPDPGLTSLSLGKAGVRALVAILAADHEHLRVASVTVGGPVAPGTAYDPDEIGEHYWRLHTGEERAREVRHGC